tara:strand:+ start:13714 stop:14460 length:747 start_codon:yes stop_codon:yes gene_type:complete
MATFTATQASVKNNKSIVTINSGESVANVRQGDFLVIANFAPSQITRAYVGGAGEQFIELAISWKHGDQTNQSAIVIPTTVEVRKAVAALQAANLTVNDNFEAMQNWQTKTGTVTFKNLDGTVSTVPTLASFLSNIVGNVSQSGGVPTGAIIERGSNVNGEYTKLADGTLIAMFEKTSSGSPINCVFPSSFVSRPFISGNSTSGAGNAMVLSASKGSGYSVSVAIIRTDTAEYFPDVDFSVIAIGRWF